MVITLDSGRRPGAGPVGSVAPDVYGTPTTGVLPPGLITSLGHETTAAPAPAMWYIAATLNTKNRNTRT
jgi:hypothetical protein